MVVVVVYRHPKFVAITRMELVLFKRWPYSECQRQITQPATTEVQYCDRQPIVLKVKLTIIIQSDSLVDHITETRRAQQSSKVSWRGQLCQL